MAQRNKEDVKGDWLKFRCTSTFKKRLAATARRESRSMANLIVLLMTKYCDEQEAEFAETPPHYLQPKSVKAHKRRSNTVHYPHGEEKIV